MMALKPENSSLLNSTQGFSLVELLVTVTLVGIMMGGIYSVHIGNTRAVNVEQERVEIQQGQRIAIDFMSRELRLAGYDREESLIPSIVDARSNFLYFTADLNNDKDIDVGGNDDRENVSFCVFDSNEGRALSYVSGADTDVGAVGSGMADGPLPLAHTHGAYRHDVIIPIEELEFYYTLENGDQTTSPDVTDLLTIRSVMVTILARADIGDRAYSDDLTYTTPSGANWGPYNDTIRRRIMSASVRFRNMGLN